MSFKLSIQREKLHPKQDKILLEKRKEFDFILDPKVYVLKKEKEEDLEPLRSFCQNNEINYDISWTCKE